MTNLLTIARRFLHDEQGQDLIEYALLVAFITLASAGIIYTSSGGSIKGMWSGATSALAAANSAN